MAGPLHSPRIVRAPASPHPCESERPRTAVACCAIAPLHRRAASWGDSVNLILLHPRGDAPEFNSRRNPDTVFGA